MNKIVLPENVKYIIETLEKAGFEGYAVGGCVRDSLLGREPDDEEIMEFCGYSEKALKKIKHTKAKTFA